jgi:tricorn protease-like protein
LLCPSFFAAASSTSAWRARNPSVPITPSRAPPRRPPGAAAAADPVDWREAEKGILENHVQLTFSDRFVKAGEAYFSPNGARIIFQAVEVPDEGEPADEFYAMYVADLVRNAAGRVTGIDNIKRISPAGSANTCGWFHPHEPALVLFATTMAPPTESSPPGFNRSSGRYRWMFPPEMRIVMVGMDEADGTAAPLDVVVERGGAYVAEGALSPDGRHVVFCSLESGGGDLFVKNLQTGHVAPVVRVDGYDGGPFFSPDGRRICYRSDRHGNHLLQLFVADLAISDAGEVTGRQREYQLTDNEHVNWCPFWHPDGRHLVYSTSEVGHHNYEIFLLDADPGDLPGSTGSVKYGTRKQRVTHAEGSDVLPVFNSDATMMMWTSRRSNDGSVQLWLADFVLDLDPVRGTDESRRSSR